jgi:hypothetical protein
LVVYRGSVSAYFSGHHYWNFFNFEVVSRLDAKLLFQDRSSVRWTQAQLETYLSEFHKPVNEQDDEPDPGPESVLQRKIERWCAEWGRPCLSFRQSKYAKRMLPAGWPDCTIIMPGGKVLFLELKSKSGRLSDEQKRTKLQFMALGHEIHLVTSYKKFLLITTVGKNEDNRSNSG